MVGTVEAWAAAVGADAASLRAEAEESERAGGVSAAAIARWRARWPAEVVACAVELAKARRKAAKKWPAEVAARLVADAAGVEMASGSAAAGHKAGRMAAVLGVGGRVCDLCCGVGGDAMGLAAAGLSVEAVDLDPVRAWMAGTNAGCAFRAGDAGAAEGAEAAFHIDPARRTREGTRVWRLADLRPGPEVLAGIVARRRDGAVKLGPGVSARELAMAGVLSEGGELEVLSEGGRLTQAVVWCGRLSRGGRTATVLDGEGRAWEMRGDGGRSEEAVGVGPAGSLVFAMDPAVERVDLVPALCARAGLMQVWPGAGLLRGEGRSDDPFVTGFRVVEELAWSRRRVREVLRAHGAGVVEVKTRGGVADAEAEQRALRGEGGRAMVVFIVRLGDGIRAIVTERV
jgi:hypothetical protein